MGMSMTQAQSKAWEALERDGWMTGERGYFLESPANHKDYGADLPMMLDAYKLGADGYATPIGRVKITGDGTVTMPKALR